MTKREQTPAADKAPQSLQELIDAAADFNSAIALALGRDVTSLPRAARQLGYDTATGMASCLSITPLKNSGAMFMYEISLQLHDEMPPIEVFDAQDRLQHYTLPPSTSYSGVVCIDLVHSGVCEPIGIMPTAKDVIDLVESFSS